MNKGLGSLGVIVAAFIVAIVGLVLIGTIGQSEYNMKTLETITDDTETITNSSCTRITTGCIDSITSVVNNSIAISSGNYTLCDSGTGNDDGVRLLADKNFGKATTLANITYTQSGSCMYIKDATTKNLVPIIVILFALAIMVGAVFYLRQTGIIDWF